MHATPDLAGQPTSPIKRRRIFLWVFVAIQALFLLWLILGISSASGAPADCGSLDAQTCNDAETAGAALGAFLIVFLWMAVDVILGMGFVIAKLSKLAKR